jgi:hypothetical protein
MKFFVLLSLTVALTIGGLCPPATADATARTVKVPGMGEMLVAVPIVHKNLTVLVLHRADKPDGEVDYLTLDEATEKGLVGTGAEALHHIHGVEAAVPGSR